MEFRSLLAILIACAASAAGFAQAQDAHSQISPATPVSTPILYQNTRYGFCFRLPADWKDYTIIAETWRGTVLDTQKTESGPELLIRSSKWTKDSPWQDIPIMIFRPTQWKLVEADNLAVSAAPIGPDEVGRNKNYVFALPPRWIGFTDAGGQDEVQALMSQHPFESPCGNKMAQPAKNIPY